MLTVSRVVVCIGKVHLRREKRLNAKLSRFFDVEVSGNKVRMEEVYHAKHR